jgi:hypothetical protein
MITVQIASVPSREEMLRKTVESLRGQCDKLFVGLNNYDHVPDFLNEGEYKFFDNSTGDAVKFYGVENLEGWVLTCDDDLIYPEGYVDKMILKSMLYGCPVTLHGKSYSRPIIAFNIHKEVFKCLRYVKKDVQVDVGGTGVMCFDTSYLKIKYSDFELPNMADLWFTKLCREQGVKIMCIAHKADYLKYQKPEETIFLSAYEQGFEIQTEILKRILI